MELIVYLAGQIHDNWREELKQKSVQRKCSVKFVEPQTNHDRSDGIGEAILGQHPGIEKMPHLILTIFVHKFLLILIQKSDGLIKFLKCYLFLKKEYKAINIYWKFP